MANDHDATGSVHSGGPPPSKRLRLMELPTDVIEEIASYTGASRCDFLLAHPRLEQICEWMPRSRIERSHICEVLQRSVTRNSQNVRALILMHCHSESSLILSLIMECPRLTELNTVNSGLTTPDLLRSVKFLTQLEVLSFTAQAGLEGSDPIPDHTSIKRVYVEFKYHASKFVMELINSCVEIEWLHLIEMNDASRIFPSLPDFPPPISQQRWEKLQTVMLSGTVIHFGEIFDAVFGMRPASRNVNFRDFCPHKEIAYHRGEFNVRNPSGQIAADENPLNKLYSVGPDAPYWHFGEPRQLRIRDSRPWNLPGSFPQSIASLTTLVELDLSNCHSRNNAQIWDPVFRSSRGIESLTVPLCLLESGRYNEGGEAHFPFVKSLESLKLKKLRSSQMICGYQSTICERIFLLPDLTGLKHLQELTLFEPPVDGHFLKRIAIPSMSCLRIIKKQQGYLNFSGLKTFFAICKNLRYLKLDWRKLPLHEKLLWWRLSGANLKQLCLRSWWREPINLDMVRKRLPAICRRLEVLHIHANGLENANEFCSVMEEEIAKINLSRVHNPVASIITADDHSDFVGKYNVIPNFPGRTLCCAEVEPRLDWLGWQPDWFKK